MANTVTIDVTVNNNARQGLASINTSINLLASSAQGAAGAVGTGGSSGGGLGGAMGGLAAVIGLSALPALGAFVPMLVGAGAAAGVAKLAFSGVGEAVALAGEDSEKYAETLKKMGPEQREFTKAVVGAKKEFSGLGKEVQKIVLPSFTEALKKAGPVIDIVKGGIKEMAGTFADLGTEFGKLFASNKFQEALKKNFSLGAGFIKTLGSSLDDFTLGLLEFGAASKPTLDAFSKGFATLLGQGLPGFFKGLESGIQGSAKMFNGLFGMINKILPAFGELAGAVADSIGPALGELFELVGTLVVGAFKELAIVIRILKPVFMDIGAGIEIINLAFGVLGDVAKNVASVLLNTLWPSFGKAKDAVGPLQKLSMWLKDNEEKVADFTLAVSNAILDMVDAAIGAAPTIIKSFSMVLTGILTAFDGIISGAAKAFGWVPGLGDKLKSANKSFDKFKNGVIDNLHKAEQGADQFAKNVRPKLEQNKLKMNIRHWTDQIADAKRKLKSVPASKQSALKARIADLQSKVAKAKGEIASVHGKTVNLNINTHKRTYNYGAVAAGTARSGLAHGGIVGHAAEGGPRSNMTLVGEQGPEIVNLAPGTMVRSNPDSRRMMAQMGGSGSQPMHVTLIIGDKKLGDLILDPLRKTVRAKGGNVQAVIGG